jgi:hypothetical protein
MSNCNQQLDNTNKLIHLQTNTRIYDRNIPGKVLQPYLDVRPVMTKYSILPIVDPRKASTVPMMQQPVYNTQTTFNPGNTQSPWSGFVSNINKESELRNQIFALQKSSQSVYVPSSKSDLYNYSFNPENNVQHQQQHSLLFEQNTFCDFNPNPDTTVVGSGVFNNSTRTQLKELGDKLPVCK